MGLRRRFGSAMLITIVDRGFGYGLLCRLRQGQAHSHGKLIGVAELSAVGVKDLGPASCRAEFRLGNRGERVTAPYSDKAPTLTSHAFIKIGDLESPSDLQPVRSSGQHRGIRGAILRHARPSP